MPVIDISKDIDNRTLTIIAEFAAPVERVWRLYADPRQLEQVWGPPSHPATFVEHELRVGATSKYYMTGPDGQRFGGWWRITGVDEPHELRLDDGFADADLNPAEQLPVSHNVFRFDPVEGGTRLTATSSYESAEALQQVIEMGVEEGSRQAMGQIDHYLAANPN